MTEVRRDDLQRLHGHLQGVWRSLALSIPGGWVDDGSGLTCIATGSTSPHFNLALANAGMQDPGSALDTALDRYRRAGLRWLLKLQPDLDPALVAEAEGRGIEFSEEPVYRCSLRAWAPSAPRTNELLSILIANADTIEDAVQCCAEAFDADPDDVRRELGTNLLAVPTYTLFIGYLGDDPVGTALLATTPTVELASVYNVATRPSHRGRGFGTALTGAAVQEAQAQGHDTVVLEPSPMGAAMYRRMGFEPFTTYLEAVMSP